MKTVTIARLLAISCIAAASFAGISSAAAQAGAALPPVEHFFANDAFGGAVLSPDGGFLAVRKSLPGRRDFLAVVDLDKKSATVVAEYADADVGNFQWVNDTRLVYDVRDRSLAVGDRYSMPGLFAVDRDGGRPIQLASRTRYEKAPQPWNTFLMSQPGSQDSEWIHVERPMYDKNGEYFGTRLRRLNTLTGVAQVAPEPQIEVGGFMLDAQGEPRLAVAPTEARTTILYRDRASGAWREIAGFDSYRDGRNEIRPLGFAPDGTLFVAANAGEDLATLRTLDVATGVLGKEAIVATPGYDFSGKLLRSDKVLGVRLTTDAKGDIWFDPAMKALHERIDKLLPRTNNLLTVPARPGSPWVLVESYSDVQPPLYLLYDTRTGALEPIGAAYPNIDPARMGRQEPIRYKARDGLAIPGLLTLPAGMGRRNLPMVVLVHGGPWVRGSSWGWDPESQFLASRGYAVLEVEYRGSAGFGVKHFEAGMKQWGLAMQDDIADGTRWAIAQGIADPRRICIAGASYGGYAALMGLVKDADLYQCAIDWIGVTDIELMYTGTWFAKPDISEAHLRHGMPILIGDLEKDAEQLKATSPIQQASRIRQPLLLAYGSQDERVPVHQGKKFRDAVKRTNRQVEWIEYDGEGHGWSLPKNRIDFWQRVERFLYKHIGRQAASAGAPAAP